MAKIPKPKIWVSIFVGTGQFYDFNRINLQFTELNKPCLQLKSFYSYYLKKTFLGLPWVHSPSHHREFVKFFILNFWQVLHVFRERPFLVRLKCFFYMFSETKKKNFIAIEGWNFFFGSVYDQGNNLFYYTVCVY